LYVYARGNVRFFLLVVVFVDMWLDKEFYLYIKLAYVCHLVVFSYLHISTWKKKWHLNSKILVYYAVVAANATILLLLLLLCVTASSFFFHTCIYVIKRAGLVMVFGKKRKTSFFFLLTLFYSFSLSLSLSPPLFRSYLIDAIFDDDVLSLFSFSCRWDSICSLKKPILNELWFDEDRKRKNETR